MKDILSFDDAVHISSGFRKRHLLIGNGFSIACRPKIFTYGSLFSNADFSGSPNLKLAFEALKTTDFEIVIRALEAAVQLLPIYGGSQSAVAAMQADAMMLKEILIKTVTANHPNGPFEITEDEFYNCRTFLSYFLSEEIDGHVYTLNYDLLLYWTLMHSEISDGRALPLKHVDGFGDDDPTDQHEYVSWLGEGSRRRSNVYFLHGALHLFDAGRELQKFTWIRSGERLKDQSWSAMLAGKMPLFVAEGSSQQKLDRIMHSAYLFQCLKSFRACVDTAKASLFIHGHSLAENDQHILREVGRGKISQVFVSLHGDPNSTGNVEIVKRARSLQAMRSERYPMELEFYDADSAHVWS